MSKKINFDKVGKGLTATGNFIAKNPKPLLVIGGSIAVVVIGVALVKRFKGAISGADIKGGKFTEQDIDETKTTISQQTAKNYAENLFDAFNYKAGLPPYGYWGTDKSVIENVFKKINSEDFKMIYNAFGKRSYGVVGSPSALERFWNNYKNLDLIGWINEELGFGDSDLKDKIRKVVEPAGFVIEK